jgi:hypothetical protein
VSNRSFESCEQRCSQAQAGTQLPDTQVCVKNEVACCSASLYLCSVWEKQRQVERPEMDKHALHLYCHAYVAPLPLHKELSRVSGSVCHKSIVFSSLSHLSI